MIRKLISKARDFRLVYILYNFFHRRRLRHNRSLYRHWQIKKPVYWNVSSVDFAHLPPRRPWLDEPGALQQLQEDKQYKKLPAATQQYLQQWINEGFIILPGFLTPAITDAVNEAIDRLLQQKKLKLPDNGKIMFAFKQSALIDALIRDERITGLFEFIFRQPVLAFQTINFLKGSGQRAHSDSIHMTTYPLGYLSAAWFALEDIDDQNGPLFYYPGSHRLPYVLSPDLDINTGILQLDPDTHQQYEDKIASIIGEQGLAKKVFHAKKGDVFLWHANLLHGGSPITDDSRSRKSMVAHYFGQNVIKYHEISQRPALIPDNP